MKKRYDVTLKNKAQTRAALRALVAGALLYMGLRLPGLSAADPTFPPAAGWICAGIFAVGAAAFGLYAWRQYRAELAAAELPPEETTIGEDQL